MQKLSSLTAYQYGVNLFVEFLPPTSFNGIPTSVNDACAIAGHPFGTRGVQRFFLRTSKGTTRHPTFFNHFRDFRRRYAVALND